MGTVITVLVLALVFVLVIRYMWRKHKRGETSCGCGSCSGCSGCALNAHGSASGSNTNKHTH